STHFGAIYLILPSFNLSLRISCTSSTRAFSRTISWDGARNLLENSSWMSASKVMTSHPGLRHFKEGISNVSQWTGAEHKAMEQVFVGLIAGAVDKRVLMAVKSAVDFIFFASLQSHTSESLVRLQQALDDFHEYKVVFVEKEIRDHFNIPKIHSMQHYVALIRLFGSADGFNTESPERLHIDYAKDAYRASNKKDYTIQMTVWLSRQEAVDRFVAFLNWCRNGSYHPVGSADTPRSDPKEAGDIEKDTPL
ncbi:hypothetical protein BDZ89DRAFT_1202723, partial [Hymenopellis radicata]